MLQQMLQQAMQLHQAGRLTEAEPLYARLLALEPGNGAVLHLYAQLRLAQGRVDEALAMMEAVLRADLGASATLTNYGIALEKAGRLEESLTAFDKALAGEPHNSGAWNNRGGINLKLGRRDAALADFDHALALDPQNAQALNNRGLVLVALGRWEEALQSYDRAIEIAPDYFDVRNNRGLCYSALHREREALGDFERLLALHPDHAGVWVNRATSLWNLNRVEEALDCYDRALALDPRNAQALANRAELRWLRKKELEPAITDLTRALALAPDMEYAPGDLTHLKMYAADWRDFAHAKSALDAGVRAGKPVVEPFVYQGLSDSPADLLACAKDYAAHKFPAQPPMYMATARRLGRIRIGYLSGEFRAQATAYLSAGLYECHDRTRFEVIAFDNGPPEDGAMRNRLEAAFDKMVDIALLSDRDAAACIAQAGIDILVNLNGYFGAMRTSVFAHRPAPIQVNYLGFPGTLGAPYMDYILGDRVVIPDAERRFFTEQVVHLPGSYQINDDKRAIAPTHHRRAEQGLPEHAFVFCHFNYSYKLTPATFAGWMRILQAVEGSVLWLLETHEMFAENIRREARARGVDSARIVFAPRLPVEEHLARLKLGDLFLDSLPYNAHTTASDALWAGLPLITCRGSAFAGRVAASLLSAAGLPELVTETIADYEVLAVRLAREPALLKSFRDRLAANRLKAPLFDTARATRHIEAAYEEMFAHWQRGEAPKGFAVAAQD